MRKKIFILSILFGAIISFLKPQTAVLFVLGMPLSLGAAFVFEAMTHESLLRHSTILFFILNGCFLLQLSFVFYLLKKIKWLNELTSHGCFLLILTFFWILMFSVAIYFYGNNIGHDLMVAASSFPTFCLTFLANYFVDYIISNYMPLTSLFLTQNDNFFIEEIFVASGFALQSTFLFALFLYKIKIQKIKD